MVLLSVIVILQESLNMHLVVNEHTVSPVWLIGVLRHFQHK